MIANLRPYPEYRDSRNVWLGRVPAHWSLTNLGAISLRRSERNRPDLPLLSVLRERGVVVRSSLSKDENHNFIPDDLSNYRMARAGDLVVNKMKAWQGSVGIAPTDGIVSPAYFIFELRGISQEYAHRLLRSRVYAVVIPPDDEQGPVVRYLDRIDRRIRGFIRNRRQLIQVLNEQKQSIINRAVTRGLDPNVTLKPSGIDWLGDIPTRWRAVRLKYVSRVQTGITLGKNYMGQQVEERPYLRVANVQTGRLDIRMVKTVAVPPSEIVRSELKPGDVLMTEGGDIDKLGRGCVWQGEIEGCLHQNHIFAVRVDQSRLLPDYLMALMASRLGRVYFQLTAKQTTNLASTNSSTLGAFPLVLPEVKEQRQILDAIGKKTLSLDAAINRAHREIDLIREYRTRLIADVVTGKVDVRHLAPSPEVIAAEAAPEDLDESLDDEKIGEDETELDQEVTNADD